jgi:hypothetical protein
MADIFVSYTASDRNWAEWIGQALEVLGHTAHLHDWEVDGGADIAAWMEVRHDKADHILCVVSDAYLKAPYSRWERLAAQYVAQTKRPNFMLPVFIEHCSPPTLLASVKRCDLYGLDEDLARTRLTEYLAPHTKPTHRVPFPGVAKTPRAPFPGRPSRI